MSPGKQLLMEGFPAPPDYLAQVQRLHVGARYTLIIYEQDLVDGSNEAAVIENLLFHAFECNGLEIKLLFSEQKEFMRRYPVEADYAAS